jgi:hypothetical protein
LLAARDHDARCKKLSAFVGRRLTLKADCSSETIYDLVNESVPRCWRRGQILGAGRFEAELAELRLAAKRSRAQQHLIAFLDGYCSQAMLEAYPSKPSFKGSPWILGAPQSGLSTARRRIRPRISSVISGLPPRGRDRQRQ